MSQPTDSLDTPAPVGPPAAAPDSQPPVRRRGGRCLWIGCGVLLALFVACLGALYYLAMHTSGPLRLMSSGLRAGGNFTIEGLEGSLARGFSLTRLAFRDEDGRESVVEGLTVRWNGPFDRWLHERFILEEVTLERAVLRSQSFSSAARVARQGAGDGAPDTGSSDPFEEGPGGEPAKPRHFELRKLLVRDLTIYPPADGAEPVSVGLFELTGLRVTDDEVVLENVTLESELLDLDYVPAQSVQLEGSTFDFSARIRALARPGLLPGLRRELDLSWDTGMMGGHPVHHLESCAGAIEAVTFPTGRTVSRLHSLTTEEWIDPALAWLPPRFTLEAVEPEGEERVDVRSGEFYIGPTRFAVPPQTLEPAVPTLRAEATVGGLSVEAFFETDESAWFPRLHLVSEPQLGEDDLLARLLHGRAYSELDAAEAETVADWRERISGAPAEE